MFTKDIVLSLFIILILDSIYLSLAGNYFDSMIKGIQGSPIVFRITGAIPCYLLLVFGLNYFIIQQNKTPFDAFLLGVLIYGIYETTNYTIIAGWEKPAVFIDTLWGGVLFAATTAVIYRFR
jgi:uncharacterized membrane protein